MRRIAQMIVALKGKDIWWAVITLLLLVNVCGLAWYSAVTGKDLKPLEGVVMQLVSFLTLLLGFRYGSSKGSKEKDKNNNNA